MGLMRVININSPAGVFHYDAYQQAKSFQWSSIVDDIGIQYCTERIASIWGVFSMCCM